MVYYQRIIRMDPLDSWSHLLTNIYFDLLELQNIKLGTKFDTNYD